jgi:hypothetical protein
MTAPTAPLADPYPAVPPASGGGVGAAALVLGVLLVVGSVVVQIVSVSLPVMMYDSGMGYETVGAIFAAFAIGSLVVGAVAVVLGLIGIQRTRARGRLAAAAGLALGASHVLGAVVSLVTPLLYSLTV